MLPGENGIEQRLRLETEGVAFRAGRIWMDKHQHDFAVPRRGVKKRPAKR